MEINLEAFESLNMKLVSACTGFEKPCRLYSNASCSVSVWFSDRYWMAKSELLKVGSLCLQDYVRGAKVTVYTDSTRLVHLSTASWQQGNGGLHSKMAAIDEDTCS